MFTAVCGQEAYMNEPDMRRQWYALQLRPRFEKKAAQHLEHNGHEAYLPMFRSRRQWSDRIKEIEVPLFPGYMFCRFDVSYRLPILVTPGVLSIVNFGGTPLSIQSLRSTPCGTSSTRG